MKFKFSTVLIAGTVLSLVALVGLKVEAEVAAVHAPSAPATPPTAAVPPGPRYSLDNLVNPFTMDRTEKTDAGYVYWFFDKQFAGNGKTLKLSVVHPHEASHAPHHHVEDEFWFVLEGKAEFFIDGKTRIVGPNTGMYAPSNVEHGIKNAGDTDLKYLVIKQYPDVGTAK